MTTDKVFKIGDTVRSTVELSGIWIGRIGKVYAIDDGDFIGVEWQPKDDWEIKHPTVDWYSKDEYNMLELVNIPY
jgi:hypothetical protein